jgi:hypothetical protein
MNRSLTSALVAAEQTIEQVGALVFGKSISAQVQLIPQPFESTHPWIYFKNHCGDEVALAFSQVENGSISAELRFVLKGLAGNELSNLLGGEIIAPFACTPAAQFEYKLSSAETQTALGSAWVSVRKLNESYRSPTRACAKNISCELCLEDQKIVMQCADAAFECTYKKTNDRCRLTLFSLSIQNIDPRDRALIGKIEIPLQAFLELRPGSVLEFPFPQLFQIPHLSAAGDLTMRQFSFTDTGVSQNIG